MLARKTAIESTMVGMPKVWQSRFTRFWWLEEYWEIHWSLVRLPSMGRMIQRRDTSLHDYGLHRYGRVEASACRVVAS